MKLRWKGLLIGLLTLGAIYVASPTIIYFSLPKDKRNDDTYLQSHIPKFLPEKHVKLGLDLQGGVQFVLGVNTNDAVEVKLDRIATEVTRWAKDKNIPVEKSYVRKGTQTLRVELKPEGDLNQFKEEFKKEFSGLAQTSRDGSVIDYAYDDEQMKRIKQGALDQAERVVRNRVDKWGVAEPLIARRADKTILVQLPGFKNPEKAKELLGTTAQLKFKIVDDQFKGFEELVKNLPETIKLDTASRSTTFISEDKQAIVNLTKGKVPEDRELLFEEIEIAGGKKKQYKSYVVLASSEIGGDDIIDAYVTRDSSSLDNRPAVGLRFTGPGGKRFADVTGANVNKLMAIILDNVVISAPNIEQKISGGSAIIRLGAGGYNEALEEANQLSLILKSGALPATIQILEERQVGSSLGPELANQGILATLVGLALVLLFMLFYYRRPGFIACLALLLNALFLLAAMASFGFALTLPGVAGFILTLGMAVDANVLINERIRQELLEGKHSKKAIDNGFDRVFWTIVDSNVTSLIAAVVLLETNSSGPIRGFAVTLIVGLLVSMFTSLYCSRFFFDWFLSRVKTEKDIRLWLGEVGGFSAKKFNFNFLGLSKLVILGGAILALAVTGIGGTKGMNWSVDFAGGTEIEVAFKSDVEPETLRDIASKAGMGDIVLQALEGGKQKYLLRLEKGREEASIKEKEQLQNFQNQLSSQLNAASPDILRVDYVGPQVGKELRTQGALSMLWALLGILIYIGIRFDMRFAPGVIVKIVTDVFIVLAFFIFFWRSFDLTSIAALLTVIGYSVNDVIVIYDRIRENLVLHPKRNLFENVNIAINETLARSINTSVVTILSLIGILVVGTAQIWNFAAAMALGVVAATSSSTFVSSMCVVWFEKWKMARARKKTALAA